MRLSPAIRITLAWTPFFLLWVLFTLAFMGVSVRDALMSGIVSTGSAALLGLPVWYLTGRLAWPDRIGMRFVGTHALAGFPYAVLWTLVGYVVASVEMQTSVFDLLRESRILGWRLLMGIWLYVIVAGISYAIQTRDRLREQERVAARAEALALQARLASLRGQLNPHFLFNALNSITTLIRHDPKNAEKAVERLADLLRYALDGGDQSTVSMHEEWEFTQEYLEMQRLRFGDRLRYDMTAEPGALSYAVPPFVLQPLVENAVEHAISNRPEGGFVNIAARVGDGVLLLSVEDDGPGIGSANARPGHGHGLSTLSARLEAVYGDRGSLALDRSVLGGTRAIVMLPSHPAGAFGSVRETVEEAL